MNAAIMDEDRIVQEMLQYERDLAWIKDNYEQLVKDYPNQYVAVLNEKLIGHALEIDHLVNPLRLDLGNNLSKVAIEFIHPEHPNIVLA